MAANERVERSYRRTSSLELRVDFTSDDAVAYAQVRASQAVARKLTLVSNNEREFRRVSGLQVENWAR